MEVRVSVRVSVRVRVRVKLIRVRVRVIELRLDVAPRWWRYARVICEWRPAGAARLLLERRGGWKAGRLGLGAVATVPAHRCRMARRCR